MNKEKIIYAAPFLGILAGTIGTRLILKIGIAAPLLAEAYQQPLGSGILSADNLTLAGGLVGLVLSTIIAARMARGRAKADAKDGGKSDGQT
ncbi:MAG TPA: hypothetical protein VM658_01055 [bacterium]|nr:hypothetical protein [bacterium]